MAKHSRSMKRVKRNINLSTYQAPTTIPRYLRFIRHTKEIIKLLVRSQ